MLSQRQRLGKAICQKHLVQIQQFPSQTLRPTQAQRPHCLLTMYFALPFIHEYSARVQISILTVLLLLSYLNYRVRLVIGGLASSYLAFKILVPLVGWVVYIFKGIAMFGFYIYFFQKAVRYFFSAVDYVFSDGLEALIRELDNRDRRRATDGR
ncbi:hypothetical protein BDZ97DRAFT_1815446 [Flammula alnicola]|nr:hypothetical protein BDZ97DRAFT_1815446 [Flammula alnicola]